MAENRLRTTDELLAFNLRQLELLKLSWASVEDRIARLKAKKIEEDMAMFDVDFDVGGG